VLKLARSGSSWLGKQLQESNLYCEILPELMNNPVKAYYKKLLLNHPGVLRSSMLDLNYEWGARHCDALLQDMLEFLEVGYFKEMKQETLRSSSCKGGATPLTPPAFRSPQLPSRWFPGFTISPKFGVQHQIQVTKGIANSSMIGSCWDRLAHALRQHDPAPSIVLLRRHNTVAQAVSKLISLQAKKCFSPDSTNFVPCVVSSGHLLDFSDIEVPQGCDPWHLETCPHDIASMGIILDPKKVVETIDGYKTDYAQLEGMAAKLFEDANPGQELHAVAQKDCGLLADHPDECRDCVVSHAHVQGNALRVNATVSRICAPCDQRLYQLSFEDMMLAGAGAGLRVPPDLLNCLRGQGTPARPHSPNHSTVIGMTADEVANATARCTRARKSEEECSTVARQGGGCGWSGTLCFFSPANFLGRQPRIQTKLINFYEVRAYLKAHLPDSVQWLDAV